MTHRIRVLLVDDEMAVRRGLRMRLGLEPDIEIVGEACDGSTAIELSTALEPDVVLMDLHLPRLDGIAATARIRAAAPQVRVLLLTTYEDASTRARAAEVGAAALIGKHLADDALLSAIRALPAGDPNAR
jgi:DNA-binding NarL/FixJ family response regulator